MGSCITKYRLEKTTYQPRPLQYDFDRCKVVKVRDGDTVVVNAFFNKKLCTFPIRLFEVDTPELKSKDPEEKQKALEAKAYTEQRLLNKVVRIEVLTGKPIPGKPDRFYEQSFDRLIGNIYIDGKSFSKELIEKGHGMVYDIDAVRSERNKNR